MSKPRKLDGPDDEPVKTTMELPRALWRQAKIRAMDTGSNLNELTVAALRAYLAQPVKRA